MELKTWLEAERLRAVRLSEFLSTVVASVDPNRGISKAKSISNAMVYQMKNGVVPANHVRAIQYFTKGAVMPWDCRPADWWIYWPELMGEDESPDVPKSMRMHWPDFSSPLGQHLLLFKPAAIAVAETA